MRLPLAPTLVSLVLLLGCPQTSDDDDADDDGTGSDDDSGDPGDDDTTVGDDDTLPGDDDDDDLYPGVDGVPSFISDRESDWSGESVAIVGDLDGDGFDDIAVGAPAGGLKESGSAPGRVHVFLGAGHAGWDPRTELLDADFTLEGSSNDDLGYVIAPLGDWNGDGLDDFATGAPHHPQNLGLAGRVWVVRGSSTGLPGGVVPIDGNAVGIEPVMDNALLGTGVAGPGDVDGDGLDDLLFSSPSTGPNEGTVYLMLGSNSWSGTLSVEDAEAKMRPGCATCYGSVAGQVIAGVGDLNDDGFADFAIGAPQARPVDGNDALGRGYVGHGRSNWPEELILEPDSGDPGAASILVGSVPSGDFGHALAGGDVDGDGFVDLLVGAPHDVANPFNLGWVYVFAGGADGLPAALTPADASMALRGTEEFHTVGSALAVADVDGDGHPEVVVGCSESAGTPDDPLSRAGRFYVFQGPINWGSAGDPDELQDFARLGTQGPEWVGESLSLGGDIDADGTLDLLVGANKSSHGADRGGESFVFYGAGLD